MSPPQVIGRRLPRIEGREKVTGLTRFAGDVRLPGMLSGKILRSPYPYARIVAIDTGHARCLRGVRAVVTGQSIPLTLVGRRLWDLPVLARDVVRFVGDRVAAVAADEPEIAEEALDLIEVEYQEFDPVLDPEVALSPDAPLLHPDLRTYQGLPPGLPDLPNVHSYVEWRRGAIEQGFDEADAVIESVFRSAPTHQAYIEPSACVVRTDKTGRVHVWMCHKNPFVGRDYLAQALGLPLDQVVLEFVRIGGDFGGKGDLRDVPIAYFLARETGRPVRLAMDSSEEFSAGSTRHGSVVALKTGVRRDGTLLAHQARIIFDSGAYGAYKPRPDVHPVGPRCAGGGYRIPNVLIQSYCVYTNHVPGGFMRAPGEPQVIFALESHMDVIAERLGLDPRELRVRNLLTDGEESVIGDCWQKLQARRVLDAAVAASSWGEPKPKPNIGRGLAISNQKIGTGRSSARLSIAGDGQVLLHTGVPDAGVGAHTMLQQVAAAILTIPTDLVQVMLGDTDESPWDMGLGASRHTHVAGRAVARCARALARQLRAIAAELVGCPDKQIRLRNGSFVCRELGLSIPFQDLARRAARSGPVEVYREYRRLRVDSECFCVQVAEVEVNSETGQVVVLSLVTANDTGTIINPLMVEGQVDGCVSQGLGFAVMEEVRLADGRVMNPHFGDYRIPTVRDMPTLSRIFIQDATGPGPFGSRPIAEYALAPAPAAIANAIYDAAGVRLTSTPLTAEKVYEALAAKSRAEAAMSSASRRRQRPHP